MTYCCPFAGLTDHDLLLGLEDDSAAWRHAVAEAEGYGTSEPRPGILQPPDLPIFVMLHDHWHCAAEVYDAALSLAWLARVARQVNA